MTPEEIKFTLKPWFTSDITLDDFRFIKPQLLIVFVECALWAKRSKLPCHITSIIRDRVEGSISDTHKGRAIDLSHVGWSVEQMNECCDYLNKTFAEKYGCIGSKSGLKTVALAHDVGNGLHFHLQVRENC